MFPNTNQRWGMCDFLLDTFCFCKRKSRTIQLDPDLQKMLTHQKNRIKYRGLRQTRKCDILKRLQQDLGIEQQREQITQEMIALLCDSIPHKMKKKQVEMDRDLCVAEINLYKIKRNIKELVNMIDFMTRD